MAKIPRYTGTDSESPERPEIEHFGNCPICGALVKLRLRAFLEKRAEKVSHVEGGPTLAAGMLHRVGSERCQSDQSVKASVNSRHRSQRSLNLSNGSSISSNVSLIKGGPPPPLHAAAIGGKQSAPFARGQLQDVQSYVSLQYEATIPDLWVG
jgi:hypothetical protein